MSRLRSPRWKERLPEGYYVERLVERESDYDDEMEGETFIAHIYADGDDPDDPNDRDNRMVGEILIERRYGDEDFNVELIQVRPHLQRQGFATVLYELAAQHACGEGVNLVSTARSAGAHSHAFWEKQLAKGRVEIIEYSGNEPHYKLNCAASMDLRGTAGIMGMTKPKVKFEPLHDFAYDLSPEDPREWDILIDGESVGAMYGITDTPDLGSDTYKIIQYEVELLDSEDFIIDVWKPPPYGASMFTPWENLRKATEAKKLVKQELERRFA